MSVQYHVQLKEGGVAPYVLLPGDPGRVELVASYWDEAHKVAENREYVTYTGVYKGVPISCTSTGIGCPSTAIALEELARVGATTFIRIGTCGAYQDYIETGDMAIFDSAARYDGASHLYAPPEFPAVASHEVVSACIAAGEQLGNRCHVGTTRTADTFYALKSVPGFLLQQLLALQLEGLHGRPAPHEHHGRRDGSQHHPGVGAPVGGCAPAVSPWWCRTPSNHRKRPRLPGNTIRRNSSTMAPARRKAGEDGQ